MTKAKSKSAKSTVKATAVKGSVRKSSIAPATSTPALIVLGFDEQQKPRGAKFVDAKPDLVTSAGQPNPSAGRLIDQKTNLWPTRLVMPHLLATDGQSFPKSLYQNRAKKCPPRGQLFREVATPQ